MKHLKTFNELNEGWKNNLVAAFTLATSVAFANKPQDNIVTKDKIELVYNDDKIMFFSACLQLTQELKNNDLSLEQRKGLAEASNYFQAKRDGAKPQKLSKVGIATVKSVESLLMDMTPEQINYLAKLGKNAKVYVEII